MTDLKQGHVPVLESLRAFAAISVCLFHFICTTIGYIETEWVLKTFSVGKFGVQMFFVISGFIIPWSMYHAGYKFKNFFSFLLKRIARLEPPYIFSIILALVTLYLRELYFGKPNEHIEVSTNQVLLHAGYLIPFFEKYQWLNPVYWTLAIEFQYYLFIALLFIPLVKGPSYLRYIIFVVLLVLAGSSNFLFYWLPVFLIGILLFMYKTKIILKTEYWITTLVVLAFCVYRYPLASVFFSVIPVLFVLLWPNLKVPGFHSFGKFSYSIYLIHPILGASLINLLSHHFTAPIAKLGVILLGTAFTITLSWITYLLIERPSKNLSASVKY